MSSNVQEDFYEVLGLKETASERDIRKAYISQCKIWHPDKHFEDIPIATERFKLITLAYETLSEPVAREMYDAKLAAHQQEGYHKQRVLELSEALITFTSVILKAMREEVDASDDKWSAFKKMMMTISVPVVSTTLYGPKSLMVGAMQGCHRLWET